MKIKTVSIIIVLAAIIIGGVLYFHSETEKVGEKVKIGVLQSWILEGPFYVAEEQGFYEDEGIDVEIIEFGSVDEFAPAVIAEEVLVAELIADMFIVQAAQESNLTQIMRKATIFGVDGILATEDIQGAEGLRGKEIAVQTISPSHFLLLNYLRDGGVSSSEVELLPTEAGNAGAAFVAGNVDVAVTWEPWLSRAAEREGGQILFSTADSPELIYDILITRNDLDESEQDQVGAVLRAWFKALDWIEENPDEAIVVFSENLGLPEEEVEFFLTKLDFMTLEENLDFYGSNEEFGSVGQYTDSAAQIWLEEGIIESKPELSNIIDASYLNQL